MHKPARTTSRADAMTSFPAHSRQLTLVGLAAAVAALLTLSLAASARAETSSSLRTASRSVDVKVAKTNLGPSIVNAKGRTLYLLTADARARGKSACYSACAKAWPPLLTTGKPIAGQGVKGSLLGSVSRTDGTRQVTYKGHRLYLFVKDKAPGQTKGQGIKGFGGQACTAALATKPCVWYAVSPAGSAIKTVAAPAPRTTVQTKLAVRAGTSSEFKFALSKTSVPLGTTIFTITNNGTIPHDFKVCSSSKGGSANACAGTASALVNPGASTTLRVRFTMKGSYEYLCTVAGHAAGGMKGVLRVT
jgi:predicted lipoprotein with Yx(FWY)xxD motif/uncharacterized cupredoxin-like copper-binding protein